ncbi:DUF4190 domain-containing protein [Herbiconiux sp. 11R-BC]|uniref:DUF4190 domain-containing protein n=1 Tax=Herbiconiux sp. 11R-BC TaxID=3111637 RepID=UPI003BFF048B
MTDTTAPLTDSPADAGTPTAATNDTAVFGRPTDAHASASMPAYPAAPQQSYAPFPPQPKTNTLGIITLVLGVLGFGIVPVVTGHIALSQIKNRAEDGRGLTLAGLILGYVTLAGWLAVAFFWIAAAGLAVIASVTGAR